MRFITRSSGCALSLLLHVLLPTTNVSAAGTSWVNAPRAVVTLVPDPDPRGFIKALEKAGGHVAILDPSGRAVVYAEDAVLSQAEMKKWIRTVIREPAKCVLDPSAPHLMVRPGSPQQRMPDAGRLPIPLNREPTHRSAAAPSALPLGADYYDTSEYMAGTVAVGVWLLDSPGTPYRWTPLQTAQTIEGIQLGLEAWVRHGGSAASLSFVLDVHQDVPVSGAPIEGGISDADMWVDEVLTNAGWTGPNAYEKCFAYNNWIRDRFHTNWCYSIFVAASDPAVNEGLFWGGGYAFGYYGGPWLMMSRFSTWADNYLDYAAVVPMHETGHIFMATDEYDDLQQTSGYFNSPDSPQSTVLCVMNTNDSTHVCQPTRDQIGWRDLDGNGVIDVVDRDPITKLDHARADPTGALTWMGAAWVEVVPNLNPYSSYQPPHAMTIAFIDRVECRIDGGSWQLATPNDGSFDEYEESFRFRPSPLTVGFHTIEARAHTSMGNLTGVPVQDTVTVPYIAPAVPRLSRGFPNPFRSSATFTLELPRSSHARLSVYDLHGRRVRTLLDDSSPVGPREVAWTGIDDRGRRVATGVYVLVLEFEGTQVTRRITLLR